LLLLIALLEGKAAPNFFGYRYTIAAKYFDFMFLHFVLPKIQMYKYYKNISNLHLYSARYTGIARTFDS